MIVAFVNFLKTHMALKVPIVFSYYSVRMLLAAMTSLLLVIFLGPRFIRMAKTIKGGNATRTEDCPLLCELHVKKKHTPSMGGLLILFSMLIAMLLWMDLTHIFTLILFITTLILGCLGVCDDYLKLKYRNTKGVSGKKKILCQAVVSGLLALYLLYPSFTEMVAKYTWFQPPIIKEQLVSSINQQNLTLSEYAARYYMPFIKEPIAKLSGIFLLLSPLIIFFVVAGTSNAVNLTDGLDGLATGCLILVASCLALFAFVSNHVELSRHLQILYVEGSGEIGIYLSALVGASIGFLWYNGHPAEVFMGDTGSLALGGIIGVSAILLKKELLLALIGGIFVVETLSVIIQVFSYRYRGKKRVFLCTPLHHHFECKGWPETKVVIRFWIVGLLLAIIGLTSLKLQ